jgi:hypothetical protein
LKFKLQLLLLCNLFLILKWWHFAKHQTKLMKYFLSIFSLFTLFTVAIAQNGPLFYSKADDLLKKTEKYLFIKVEVNKNEATEGEYILANYRLYVAVDIQGKLSKAPRYTGFASYDIENINSDSYEVEKINGTLFRVYLIKSVQLFGLISGKQRLEPIELDATIRYLKAPDQGNKFYLHGTSEKNDTLFSYTLRSKPIEILIKKLPDNHSNSFTGAVGQFKITTLPANKDKLSGKADTIQFLLEGNGNWHNVIMPKIGWPKGVEVFEPTISENLNAQNIPLKGIRIVSYPLVIQTPGIYSIPPVEFTYYNPEKKIYQTTRTDTIFFEVKKGEKSVFPEKNITKSPDYTSIFSKVALVLFPLTALLLLILLRLQKKDKSGKSKEN